MTVKKIEEIQIDLERVQSFLQTSKFFQASHKVIVYGAGPMAVMTLFELSLIKTGIACFTEEKPELAGMFGVPIVRLENLPAAGNLDPVVVITKDFENYAAIVDSFKQKGYFKFVNLADSPFSNRQMQRRIDWQWLSQLAGLINGQNFNDVASHLFNSMCAREEKKVVAIVVNISPRAYKILKEFKKRGFVVECIFLSGAAGAADVKQSLIDLADSCAETASHVELIVRLMESHASFVHMFSHVWNFEHLAILSYLIYKKNFLPTIVFDEYDVGKLYTKFSSLSLDLEKFCVENADIVCDRSFEVDYLTEEHGYILKGKRVQLFDGCDEETTVTAPAVIKSSEPLRLVYAGSLVDMKVQDDWDWAGVAERCERNRCHLEVYPSPGNWARPDYKQFYGGFFELDKNYEYFHLHNPIPYRQLIETLSRCDYGIHPFNSIKPGSNAARDGYYGHAKAIYCTSNHFFDYINAGVPILSHYPERMMQYFKQLGIAADFKTDEYDFEFLKENRAKYRAQVQAVREKFLLKNLILDLLKLIVPTNSL